MRYEKLEDQGAGSREALKFLPGYKQQEAAETEVEVEDTMTVVTPGSEVDWKKGIKLKEAAIHASDLTHQDLISRLRAAQISAVQGDISSEFNGLGSAATDLAAKGVTTFLTTVTGGTPEEKETRRQEEETKKRQTPLILISGVTILVLLTYIMFFR